MTRYSWRTTGALILAVMGPCVVASPGRPSVQTRGVQNQAELLKRALGDLESEDPIRRTDSQEALLKLGPVAIPPLVDMLRSLTPNVEVCPPGSDLPCATGIIKESASRRRARSDVIAVLGHLRAVESISLLIKNMGIMDSLGAGFRYSGPEKLALIEIGAPAVPQLLDSLQLAGAERRRISQRDGLDYIYFEIEVRIVDVLGEIGDGRALPFLEAIKCDARPILASYLDEAIQKLNSKRSEK